jgi:Cu(I)/Ag(I) efflux system membrane protein CusA/SilA
MIVFLMLFLNHGSIGEALIILLTIPFSLIGTVWLLYLLDYNMSIAVWVGMIALAGLDAEMGVLMMLYMDLSCRQRSAENRLQSRQDLTEAIIEGAVCRIRPKLMTGMTMLIGLAPILWNTGTGADVTKRIAAPMVGGIISALLMVLIVFPAVYSYLKGWRLKSAGQLPRAGKRGNVAVGLRPGRSNVLVLSQPSGSGRAWFCCRKNARGKCRHPGIRRSD